MKPIPFKVTEKENASFHVQVKRQQHQYDFFHYHPEYQISLIREGKGKATIGHCIDPFAANDIYIIGAQVPHVFKTDEEYCSRGHAAQSHIVSLFFREDAFGKDFFLLPEMHIVRQFLEDCAKGVKLYRPLAERIRPLMLELVTLSGALRIIQLLQILHQTALNKEKRFLSPLPYQAKEKKNHSSRLNRILHYISENFDRPISLEEAARVANLSKYAFCRYFKKKTNKSFIDYLNEFRVGMACKLLSGTTYNISQVSMLSGFNTISYFNRQFKKFMRCTPTEYRKWQRKLT